MQEEFLIECPDCGESVPLYVEFAVEGRFAQDGDVCCHPWLVDVHTHGAEREAAVTRADGTA